ncbi:Leucine-rich melanocyte differentiation-associated protein [Varanus komodoensis]|nr:Leucine-rich melanocyte differentiation-associated protein [Varanus komodoensis]
MEGAVLSGTQVSYIGQDCSKIPEFLGRKYGSIAKRLDLSFNLLRTHLAAFQGNYGPASGVPVCTKPVQASSLRKRCVCSSSVHWVWASGLGLAYAFSYPKSSFCNQDSEAAKNKPSKLHQPRAATAEKKAVPQKPADDGGLGKRGLMKRSGPGSSMSHSREVPLARDGSVRVVGRASLNALS